MTRPLAIFDFDKTLTEKDTLWAFLQYMSSTREIIRNSLFLSPLLIGYKTGLLSQNKVKEQVFSNFFGGMEADKFNRQCHNFAMEQLPGIENSSALEKLTWHKEEGHRIVVVSASIENYLIPWCREKGIEGIGTQLEQQQGLITGKFKTPNCYGPEKVRRLKSLIDLEEYTPIYAYGDSRGDYEMLALADHPYFRAF